MHDALFENQSILSISTIFTIADKLRLPKILLRNTLETGQYSNRVRNDFMGGVRHDGAYDFASLASAIQLRLTADSHDCVCSVRLDSSSLLLTTVSAATVRFA